MKSTNKKQKLDNRRNFSWIVRTYTHHRRECQVSGKISQVSWYLHITSCKFQILGLTSKTTTSIQTHTHTHTRSFVFYNKLLQLL